MDARDRWLGSSRPVAARWMGLAAALALASGSGACKRKDPAQCENAQNVIKQATASEDFAAARQWRDYAYKACGDRAQLEGLDREIVTREADSQKKKQEEAAKKARTDELVKLFVGWTSQHRAAPTGAAVNVSCSGEENEKKERWCSRERAVGEHRLKVAYWEAEPLAFEFSTLVPGPVSCDALGPGSVLRTAHDGALLHCQLSGGPLNELQALIVRTAQGTAVSIVSAKFIELHAGFRQRLAR